MMRPLFTSPQAASITTSGGILMLLCDSVARTGPLSLTRQLRATVELAILSSELPPATRLPSIRRVSSALKIAPGTVARAYQDLVAEGLVVRRERSGFFVSFIDQSEANGGSVPNAGLLPLIDELICATRDMETRQLLRLVAARRQQAHRLRGRLAVLGHREVALAERVRVVASALADLWLDVIGVAYEDFSGRARSADLPYADIYLVPVLETEMASRLPGIHRDRIVPMTRRLRSDQALLVATLPSETRFAIIAVDRDAIGRALAMVRRLHPVEREPLLASVDEPEKVTRAITNADVVIASLRVRAQLTEFEPIRAPVISFVYIPDEVTIAKLRARLDVFRRPSRSPAAVDERGSRQPVYSHLRKSNRD
jgi:DNA-binding transcriptional regulator YhcF (GntR family)